MPVIHEEDESHDRILHTDFSSLLDLPESAFPESDDVLPSSTVPIDPLLAPCVAHPDTSKYVARVEAMRVTY